MESSERFDGHVLFLDEVHPILEQRLTQAGFTCVNCLVEQAPEIRRLLSGAVGIVVRSRFKIDKEFLTHAPNLKFIARSGSGMENIDIDYAKHLGIACFNSPEGNRNAVGEHALGMLLALFNRLPTGNSEVKNGVWNREENRGIELKGKTIGIVGFGNTGSSFAKKLTAMECTILVYDKYKSGYGDELIQECQMQEIFDSADIVSFHVPLTEETTNLFSIDYLNNFKKPIYLINTSRGQLTTLSALTHGLKSGKLQGCCLDVLPLENFNFELGDNTLTDEDLTYILNSENVLLSPHVAGWTRESYEALSNVLADKILQEFN